MTLKDNEDFLRTLAENVGESAVGFLKRLEEQLVEKVTLVTKRENFERSNEPGPYVAVNDGILQFTVVVPDTGEEATFLQVTPDGEIELPYDDEVVDATPLTDEIMEACGKTGDITLRDIVNNQDKISKIILDHVERYVEAF